MKSIKYLAIHSRRLTSQKTKKGRVSSKINFLLMNALLNTVYATDQLLHVFDLLLEVILYLLEHF